MESGDYMGYEKNKFIDQAMRPLITISQKQDAYLTLDNLSRLVELKRSYRYLVP